MKKYKDKNDNIQNRNKSMCNNCKLKDICFYSEYYIRDKEIKLCSNYKPILN